MAARRVSRVAGVVTLGHRAARHPQILAYVIKLANVAAAFATTVVIARMAGAATLGEYTLAIATAGLLVTMSVSGLDQILLRLAAGDLRLGLSARARGTLHRVARQVFATSTAVALALALVASFTPFARQIGTDARALTLAALVVALMPMLLVGLAGIRTAGHPVRGQLLESVHSLLLAAAMLSLVAMGRAPSAALVVGLLAAALTLSTALVWWVLLRLARHWSEGAGAGGPSRGPIWLGLPVMATSVLHLTADWLVLVLIAGQGSPEEVGAFRTAIQIVALTGLVVATGETAVSAGLAGDFRARRLDMAWRRFRNARLIMAALAGPVLLAAVVAPEWILVTAFGPAFGQAATALAILAFGQAINVLTGPIGRMLAMSGRESTLLMLAVASLVLMVGLGLLLIPRLGLAGAAIASASAMTLRNLGGYVIARRTLRAPTA